MNKFLLPLLIVFSTTINAQMPMTGLVAWYPFTSNAIDSSGNGNNGIVHGATLTTDYRGRPNQAYYFNGSSNYIMVPSSTSLSPATSISMCAVVKPQGFYSGNCQSNTILQKGFYYQPGFYDLVISDQPYDNGNCTNYDPIHETVTGGIGPSGPTYASQVYTPYTTLNAWYCVIATFDGDSLRVYINGVKKYTVKNPSALGTNTDSLSIGYNSANPTTFPYWFHGVIDDIAIYNRALTLSEIISYCSFTEGVSEQEPISSFIEVLGRNPIKVLFKKTFQNVQVNIFTILGQTVYSKKLGIVNENSFEDVNIENLSRGIYLLRVSTDEGSLGMKIIKD